ncbi:hypothetical protein B9Z55_022152 [Caenorhabditis nigoni]|uniref:Uncharacterized protein n=1 Tax=Caenorhabditis nigoni TaxID=1611254 RepID=A0A2G5TVM0_9PELO|nr:hypothetical protein B9Z55_022152 [Caenorhabditis nigoni]
MEPPRKKPCVEKDMSREEIIYRIGIELLVWNSPKEVMKLYEEIYGGDCKTLKERLNEVRAEKGEGEVDDNEFHKKMIRKIKKENLESMSEWELRKHYNEIYREPLPPTVPASASAPIPAPAIRSFEDDFYEDFLDVDEDTKRAFREEKKVREEEERKVQEEEERTVQEEERRMKEIRMKKPNAATPMNDEKKFGASENSPQQKKAAPAAQPVQPEKPKCSIPGLGDIENWDEFMKELEEAKIEEKKKEAAKRKAAEAAAAEEEERKKKLEEITTVPTVLTEWNDLIPVRRVPIVRRTMPSWSSWNGLIRVKGSLVRTPIEQVQHRAFLPLQRVHIPVDNEGMPPRDPRSSFWMKYNQK